MAERWMDPDEGISLEAKVFAWIRTPYNINGNWVRLYLTNKRLYVKARLFGVKMLDFRFENIKSVVSDEKYLTVKAVIESKHYSLKIKKKGLDPSWEWMIRQRVE